MSGSPSAMHNNVQESIEEKRTEIAKPISRYDGQVYRLCVRGFREVCRGPPQDG